MTSSDVKRCPASLCELNSNDKSIPVISLKCGHTFHKVCLEILFITQQRFQQNLYCPMCKHPAHFLSSEIQPLPIWANNSLRVKSGNDMLYDLALYNRISN